MKEQWKQVPGYEWRYEVSDQGNVRSWITTSGKRREKPKILNPQYCGKKYLQVVLQGQQEKVHRLVAIVFLPRTTGKDQVNHIDGDKENNKIENLEWCTQSENQTHSYKTGITKRKLTPENVKEIRHLYANTKVTQKKIAEYFGIYQQHVSAIINNKKWGFI